MRPSSYRGMEKYVYCDVFVATLLLRMPRDGFADSLSELASDSAQLVRLEIDLEGSRERRRR